MLDVSSIDFKVKPDFKYESPLFAKLINKTMKDGKKAVAEKIVYGAFTQVQSMIKDKKLEIKKDGNLIESLTDQEILELALEKVCTGVEVVTQRVGGSNYKIPRPVSLRRSVSLALRWIVESMSARSEKTSIEKLANEIADILNDRGGAIKKKVEIEKNAEANKAFAHFLRTVK